MRIYSDTKSGGGDEKNEDHVVCVAHPSGDGRLIGAVADGVGGRPDGDVASRTACEVFRRIAAERDWAELKVPSTWDELFSGINQEVKSVCDGSTTMAAFAIDIESVSGASVGDSRIYISNEDENIELTCRQRKAPFIGEGEPRAEFFFQPEPSGRLLAMTDGVWKYCGYTYLFDHLRADPPTSSISKIRACCELDSGQLPDDFTLLLITI